MSETAEERRHRMATNAAAHLANGTWPQVLTVFGYDNPRAPRVDPETYQRLQNVLQAAGCTQIATFAGLVSMQEQERGVTMSFNVSLCKRRRPGNVEDSEESLMDHLTTPDMLIGTRRGVEGAAVWLEKFAAQLSLLPSESIQLVDRIFGEVVACMSTQSKRLTVEDMIDIAAGHKTFERNPDPPKQ